MVFAISSLIILINFDFVIFIVCISSKQTFLYILNSVDHYHYYKSIDETIAEEREYRKAEDELVAINKLTESPKWADVRNFININKKLKEGMVA